MRYGYDLRYVRPALWAAVGMHRVTCVIFFGYAVVVMQESCQEIVAVSETAVGLDPSHPSDQTRPPVMGSSGGRFFTKSTEIREGFLAQIF